MKNRLKMGWTLQRRITFFTVALVLAIIVQITILTYLSVSRTVEQQIGNRALHIATQVATDPQIIRAFGDERPWETIQPIVEDIRSITDAEFIVVGNKQGIRYSHPLEDRIGKEMVGGDNEQALRYGKSYVSKARGSLGLSLRGKVPIKDGKGQIIGIVSVGFLLKDIHQIAINYGKQIAWVACSGLLVGVIGAVVLARNIKKTLFGLEPEEISSLYEVRDAVIQSIREGIMVIDKEGTIVLLNETARNILALPRGKDVIGKPVLDVVPNGELLQVLKTGRKQLDQETELGGKVIIANRIPVRSGGKVIGVVSSFRLKSEMDQLTEELSQVKRYTEALRAQTHEFNNMLYTISGLIQLEAYEEALELIHKESADKQDLIQFITNHIKAPWLGGILLGFMNRAKELRVDLVLDRESSLASFDSRIDSGKFVSILGNLVSNAFDAVLQNEESDKKVRIFIIDIGDDMILEVEDTGPGIGEDAIPQIFELGYTTKDNGSGKRGYGLARVRELVGQLGGSITVERGGWGGALFIVAIPKDVKGNG
ncbi:ATP-binding protein [Paenibacillus thermotolerans]|uniref:ATP-binding protein n=1 Tax=Paenibacillus thermotolerans TaxID=3027807 RepID=UPI002367A5B9|nr:MULTISPECIES: sensor histidine kinase [unclassified Paenibacillus]